MSRDRLGAWARLRGRDEARTGLLFVSPVLLVTALVLVIPSILALGLSFTDFDIYALGNLRTLRFTGLGNYRELLVTPLFWRAAANTALLTVLGVPAAIGASLGAALLLDRATIGWKPFWRLLLFAPSVVTVVSAALAWRYVLNTRFGLLNYALSFLGIAPIDWLGDPRFSMPSIVLFVVWKVFGYNMVIFTAALSAVQRDLLEAARLDGAGAWSRFRHVTLPAIGPTLTLATLLSVANFLQIFTEPYVMTHGGPAQSTVTLLYFMFQQGFEWWSLGSASAVALILFLCILGVTLLQARLARRLEWF